MIACTACDKLLVGERGAVPRAKQVCGKIPRKISDKLHNAGWRRMRTTGTIIVLMSEELKSHSVWRW